MKPSFSDINEKLFSSCEISSIGRVGTMSLLHGRIAKALNFIGRAFAYTQTRAYGCFLLSFGLLTMLMNIAEVYFTETGDVALSTLIICASLMLIAIPLLLFERPMCIAMQDFPLTDKLFFEFLSIKRMRRSVTHVGIHPVAAFVFGIIPSGLAHFFSIESVIVVLVMLIVVNVAFTTPEFSMLLSILFFPYVMYFESSGTIVALISVVTLLSFVIKVIVGKRVFHFSIYDVFFFLLTVSVLTFGLLSGAQTSEMLVTAAILFGYFPISNLIVNRRLAECAEKSVIVSAVPMVVVSMIEIIAEGDLSPEALFDSSETLVAFMLVSAAATFAYTFGKARGGENAFCFVLFVLEFAVISISMRPEAILAILISAVSYLVLRSRQVPSDFLLLLLVLPYALFFLPGAWLDAVSDLFRLEAPLSETVGSYRDLLIEFFDNVWVGGSGIGVVSGTNTLLGLGFGFGIFSVLLFGLLVLIRLRHVSYFRTYMRNSPLGATGDMATLSIVALLSYGAFYNLFSDRVVLSLLVAVFAVSAAALRTAKKEYDDRMGYYEDSGSSESSAIDVGVNHYY